MIKTIAEIGINHNGDLEIAKHLITIAKLAGMDYVKFQKRNLEVCIPEHMRNNIRETPWGDMTYMEYKKRIEFEKPEYDEIDRFSLNREYSGRHPRGTSTALTSLRPTMFRSSRYPLP